MAETERKFLKERAVSCFRKTDLFGICCVFSFLPHCEGPTGLGYSTCNSLMKSSGLTAVQWIISFSVFASNIAFLTIRFIGRRTENSAALLALAVNLCVSYILGALSLLITVSAVAHYNRREDFLLNYFNAWVESAWCSLIGVLYAAGSQASTLFMLLICWERFASVVVTPNADASWRTATYVACPVAWLVAFILASMPLLAKTYFQDVYYSWSSLCIPLLAQTELSSQGWQYSFGVFFFFDFVVLMATLCVYVVLVLKADVLTKEKESDVLSRSFELDKTKTLLPAVVLDALCWLPFGVLSLLGSTGEQVSVTETEQLQFLHQVHYADQFVSFYFFLFFL